MPTLTAPDPRVEIALAALQTLRDRASDPEIWPPVQVTEPRVLEYLLTHSARPDTAVNSRHIEKALELTQSTVQKAIVALPGSLLLAGIEGIRIHRIPRCGPHGGNHYYITITP